MGAPLRRIPISPPPHQDTDVGQVSNLRRIFNPPGEVSRKPEEAGLEIRRRLETCPTSLLLLLRRSDHLQSHLHDSLRDHVDLSRGAERKIDDASIDERSSIGDANVDAFSIRQVCHLDPSVEWKCSMRGSQLSHIENFAGRCLASIEWNSIPTCDSSFDHTDARWCLHSRGSLNSRVSLRSACAQECECKSEYARSRMNRPQKH